jgi:hypothetical protein
MKLSFAKHGAGLLEYATAASGNILVRAKLSEYMYSKCGGFAQSYENLIKLSVEQLLLSATARHEEKVVL